MTLKKTNLHGCFLINYGTHIDSRGTFKKIYTLEGLNSSGINTNFQEQYFSISDKNVIRGMHFQVPDYAQDKLVTCLTGKVLDVIIDLRKNYGTYGQFESSIFDSSKDCSSIFLPAGIAHGFLSLEENSGMLYSTSTEYIPRCDKGISWNSFGFEWPCSKPIISERDSKHEPFNLFKTPF